MLLSPLLSVIFLVMMSQFLPQFFYHKIDALCFILLSLNHFCTDFICPPMLCPWTTHSMACYSFLVTLIPRSILWKQQRRKTIAKRSCAFKAGCIRASYPDLGGEHAVEPPEPKHCCKGDKYLLCFISVFFLSVRQFLSWGNRLGDLEEEQNVAKPHLATGLKEDCRNGNIPLNSFCHLFSWLLFDLAEFSWYIWQSSERGLSGLFLCLPVIALSACIQPWCKSRYERWVQHKKH